MSRKFNVGDRVRIVHASEPWTRWNGVESIVVSDAIWDENMGGNGVGKWKYQINEPGQVYAAECCLEPIYDGHEKTSWSECAWKPKHLERVS